jgi:hypothetical protein
MMVPLEGEFCAEETILVEVASPNRKRHYDAKSEGRSPRLVASDPLLPTDHLSPKDTA